MRWLSGALSLLTGIAGWFYLFYSRAAQQLGDIESQAINIRRARLRRVGGLVMICLAVLMYAGFSTLAPQQTPSVFLGIWLGVFVLLAALVCLAFIDLRLTMKLRGVMKAALKNGYKRDP